MPFWGPDSIEAIKVTSVEGPPPVPPAQPGPLIFTLPIPPTELKLKGLSFSSIN